MNKCGVSRRWFTEADVKDFKNTALRIVKNITRSMVNWGKKRIPSQVHFLIDLELPTLKIDFFVVLFVEVVVILSSSKYPPPRPPSPSLINFSDFILQIFQRFLKPKPIILFAKLQAI